MAITLDYESLISQLAYVLNTENSTTSLNADLAESVATSSVFLNTPDKVIMRDEYPAIVLEVVDKTEEFSAMGQGAASDRTAIVAINIANIVKVDSSNAGAMREARLLTRNVETILRAYPRLGTDSTTNLIDWINPASTDFDLGADLNGVFVAVGLIRLEMQKELKNA